MLFDLLLFKIRYYYPFRFEAATFAAKKGSYAPVTDLADAGGCPDAALWRRFSGHPLGIGAVEKITDRRALAPAGDVL
jgi:hypothetical protein